MAIELRPGTQADTAFICRVFRAALPLYQNLMPGILEANIANLETMDTLGLSFAATGLEPHIFEHRGQAFGFSGVGILNPQQAYLATFYLLPEHQRKGWGGQALRILCQLYAAQGFSEMLLQAHQQAPWALNFYIGQGFSEQARGPEAIAKRLPTLRHLIEKETVLLTRPLP
jgi:ribosomal protein S18 acetylase RimI-like enzyme